MNRLSRKIGFAIVAIVVPVSLSTATIFAAPATTTRTTAFCTNLPSTISKVNSSLSNLQSKLTTAWNNRNAQIATNDTKWDQALAADRAKWAAQRQNEFTELQAKATTDAQKAAVQTYITALSDAINSRESANDQARATFRSGLTSLLASQQSTINSQVATFTGTVNAAEATAQSSCAATPSDTSIRTTFVSATRTARSAYNSDRKSDSGIGTQVKALAATRDAAIKANDTAFAATAKAEATALKAAFAGTGTNVSG